MGTEEKRGITSAQTKFLRHLLGMIKLDKEVNLYIEEKREYRT